MGCCIIKKFRFRFGRFLLKAAEAMEPDLYAPRKCDLCRFRHITLASGAVWSLDFGRLMLLHKPVGLEVESLVCEFLDHYGCEVRASIKDKFEYVSATGQSPWDTMPPFVATLLEIGYLPSMEYLKRTYKPKGCTCEPEKIIRKELGEYACKEDGDQSR